MSGGDLGSGERVLYSVAKTRKGFFIEYTCAVFLMLLAVYSKFTSLQLSLSARKVIFGVGLVIFIYAELSRVYIRYKFTNKKIIIITGILRQHKKSVYYHPLAFVPDINVEQNIIGRIFNFGTISVRGSAENAFEIKDIDSPQEVMKDIERLIEETRSDGGGLKK